jgi:hypothetical protein
MRLLLDVSSLAIVPTWYRRLGESVLRALADRGVV